jgi:hypothetical protein
MQQERPLQGGLSLYSYSNQQQPNAWLRATATTEATRVNSRGDAHYALTVATIPARPSTLLEQNSRSEWPGSQGLLDMNSKAKEQAELLFLKRQEVTRALSEYEAKEQATRELTAKLRAERLEREAIACNPKVPRLR